MITVNNVRWYWNSIAPGVYEVTPVGNPAIRNGIAKPFLWKTKKFKFKNLKRAIVRRMTANEEGVKEKRDDEKRLQTQ